MTTVSVAATVDSPDESVNRVSSDGPDVVSGSSSQFSLQIESTEINQRNSIPSNIHPNHSLSSNKLQTKSSTSSPSRTKAKTSTVGNYVDAAGSSYNVSQFTASSEPPKVQLRHIIQRNAAYVWEQVCVAASNRTGSLFVPIVCATIVLFYIVNCLTSYKSRASDGSENVHEYSLLFDTFTMVPGRFSAPYFWLTSMFSPLTYQFVEMFWWQVIIDVVVITLSSTLIEPLWGSRELVTFFLFVNISAAFFSVLHYFFIYSVYGDASSLYSTRIYGMSSYCAAVCVTVKQILPESILWATSVGKLKNENVPFAAFILCIVLRLLNLIPGHSVVLLFYGIILSWLYLRFYQPHPSNQHRGDLSDSFSFASFFPNVIRPIVAIICNSVYVVFVKIKLCPEVTTTERQYRLLSERFSQEHNSRRIHKQHQSGDYQHLLQPARIQNL